MNKPNEGIRKEQDFLGEMEIPSDALYGIHSLRARENFPDSTAFHKEWYEAIGIVKKACYMTSRDYFAAASLKFPGKNIKTVPSARTSSARVRNNNVFSVVISFFQKIDFRKNWKTISK